MRYSALTVLDAECVVLLLNASRLDCGIGHHAALDEQLAAAAAARLQPFFVEPQEVDVARAARALAHLAEHVDECDELVAELGEHGRERVALDAAQRVV